MLSTEHFNQMEKVLASNPDRNTLKEEADKIRMELNPHPAGQQDNVPVFQGQKLTGIQHKYRETSLFFPSNSQTCHAYCTFCFRWPQFVGIDELKFAMKESELLVGYLKENPSISDVLFTGGDPMVMSAKKFETYINPLLEGNIESLQTIRIGTKSLGYWPYRFTTDKDADDMLRLFEKVVKSGKHLAFMAHFNHPHEMQTPAVREAIRRILDTGAQIRTQSPVMKHISDHPAAWEVMWKEQSIQVLRVRNCLTLK
ncbi:MAG: KamA family radical SAM protein [Luteibaculum sp.]